MFRILIEMIEKNIKNKIVGQNTELGSLGLSCLLEKGFCGPNYDLSDCNVGFYLLGDNISISFYDMFCVVRPKEKYYDEMIKYFKED